MLDRMGFGASAALVIIRKRIGFQIHRRLASDKRPISLAVEVGVCDAGSKKDRGHGSGAVVAPRFRRYEPLRIAW